MSERRAFKRHERWQTMRPGLRDWLSKGRYRRQSSWRCLPVFQGWEVRGAIPWVTEGQPSSECTGWNVVFLFVRMPLSPSSTLPHDAAVSHTASGSQEVICTLLGNLDHIHCCFPFTLRINEKIDSSGCQICVPVLGDCFFFFASVCTLNSKKKVAKLKEFPQK